MLSLVVFVTMATIAVVASPVSSRIVGVAATIVAIGVPTASVSSLGFALYAGALEYFET